MKLKGNFSRAMCSAAMLSIATGAAAQGNPDTTGQAALLSGDGQRIGFTGYQKDEVTGLYYANARWYDPLVGGFNAMDPAMGSTSNPITFNRYLYANANPTRYVDPTGKYAEAGHYYTTYYVALKTGFAPDQARTLALYSQAPDEISNIDAYSLEKFARLDAKLGTNYDVAARRDLMHPGIHALTNSEAQRETAVTSSAIGAAGEDLRAAGILIHRLGDSYAHRRLGPGGTPNSAAEGTLYAPRAGHGADLHAPDIIQRRPELYSSYVDQLTGVLGQMRGMDGNQVAALRSQLRKDLAPLLKAVPTSGPQGLRKSDSVLEAEAEQHLRALLVQEFKERRKGGADVPDLTYHPEQSGPGLFDVMPTTADDLADSLLIDYVTKRPGDQYSNQLSRDEARGFARGARDEAAQIEPSVQRALGTLQQSRGADCSSRGRTVGEAPSGGVQVGGCN